MATSKTSPTAGEIDAEAQGDVPSGDVTPVIAVNGAEPNTDAPKEPSGEKTVEETPKMSELKGIRYVGMADVKTLTKDDLTAISGKEAKGDLVWSAENGKVVPTEEFNAATRDALLADPNFVAE